MYSPIFLPDQDCTTGGYPAADDNFRQEVDWEGVGGSFFSSTASSLASVTCEVHHAGAPATAAMYGAVRNLGGALFICLRPSLGMRQ